MDHYKGAVLNLLQIRSVKNNSAMLWGSIGGIVGQYWGLWGSIGGIVGQYWGHRGAVLGVVVQY